MIAHRREGIRKAGEDCTAVVNHRRGLAMHQAAGANDLRAEGVAQTLMTQADAEDRKRAGKFAQQSDRDSGLGGSAGPGRDDYGVRLQVAHGGNGDRIIAMDGHTGAEFAEILNEVVGEGVVIIDHDEPERHRDYLRAAASSKSRAAPSARTIARALLHDSSNSAAGSESATTPPPAWI